MNSFSQLSVFARDINEYDICDKKQHTVIANMSN